MILANTFMVVWLLCMHLGGVPLSVGFFMFEYFITAVFGLEILVMMVSKGTDYFKKTLNLFDLFVFCLCMVNIFLFHSTHSYFTATEELDELLESSLLLIRYGVQCARLWLMFKRDRLKLATLYRQRAESSLSIVNFDAVIEEESDEDIDIVHSFEMPFIRNNVSPKSTLATV